MTEDDARTEAGLESPALDSSPVGTSRNDRAPARSVLARLLAFGSLAALLAGWVGLLYRPALEGSFHLDDRPNIVYRPALHPRSLDSESLVVAWKGGRLSSRPLANLSFALDWYRGSGSPEAFLATNVAIHVACTLSVFMLLVLALEVGGIEAGKRLLPAWAGALVWGTLPLHVQAVAYVVQRMASLATLFVILAVISFLKARKSGGVSFRWLLATGAFIALGTLCKEIGWLALPLILLAEIGVCRNHGDRIRSRWDLPLVSIPLLAVGWIASDLLIRSGPISAWLQRGYTNRPFTLTERLLTQPRVVLFHLSQIFWPMPNRFSIEHDVELSRSLIDPWVTLPSFAVVLFGCGLGLACLLGRPGRRIYGFFILWFPASLLMESTVYPLELIFEHRMYMPTVALGGILALGLTSMWKLGPRIRGLGLALSLIAAVVGSWAVSARLPDWRTEEALYQSAVLRAPRSARVWTTLGRIQLREGEIAAAESSLRRALALPARSHIHQVAQEDLAVILLDQGRPQEALDLLEPTRQMSLPDSSLLNHLGEAYLGLDRFEEAREALEGAVALAPRSAVPRWNLALTLEKLDRCLEARFHWSAYLELESDPEERKVVEEHLEERHRTIGAPCWTGD